MKMKKLVPILICLLICNFAFALGSGDSSLLTWWKMDDISGTVVNDYADNMDGTIGTENTWFDDSLYFPGQDFNYGASKVSCDESIFSQISDEITITFWAKNDMPNCTKNCYFFTAEIGGNRVLQIDLTGKTSVHLPFKAAIGENNPTVWNAWSPQQENYTDPNLWNYYSFTKNASTGKMKIYINDQLRATSTGSNTSMAGIDSFEICGSSANYHQWAGWVKDFRIYNKELYSEQLNTIKKQFDPSLITWWKFDETSGNVAADSIGTMDGTIGNHNYWTDGGLYFDGANYGSSKVAFDTGDTADTFSQISGHITIAFWAKSDRANRHGNNRLFTGKNSSDVQLINTELPTSGYDINFKAGLNDDRVGFNDVDDTNSENYIDMSKWHYYVFTKNTTTPVMKIFIDGKMVRAETRHDPTNYFFGSMAGITFFEFAGNSANWHQFAGVVKDFKIYDRALTPQEVKWIYFDYEKADFNYDTVVDIYDLQLLAQSWLDEGQFATADADKDNEVDLADYAYLANAIEPLNEQLHKPGWTLAFHDEFDGDDIDTTKWNIGAWSTYTNLCYQPSDDPDVYNVNNGSLKLYIIERDYYDPGAEITKHYGSGGIESHHKFDPAFGYIECSAKLPVGTGAWPAFWLMPIIKGGTWWPNAEIDIMEHVYDSSIGDIGSNIHWNDYGDDHVCWSNLFAGDDTEYHFNPPNTAFDDFHVYAMKWEPGAMYFYVDGYNYATYRDEDAPDTMYTSQPASYNPDNIKVPTNPGYLRLGTGLAPWITPNIQGTVPTYEIDYVRVYKKNE